VQGDKNALAPGGVRIGTPAMTTRGCDETDFRTIACFLKRTFEISVKIQEVKGKKLKDFEDGLDKNPEIVELRKDVEQWARQFGFPGL